MKIHLICESNEKETHGTLRVQEEIIKRLKNITIRRTDYEHKKGIAGKFNTLLTFPIKVFFRSFGQDVNHFFHHNFAYILCFLPFKNPIVTCYDLIYLKRKDLPFVQRLFNRFCIKGMKKAIKIITISEFSKKEIMHCLNIEPGRVIVAYPGYDKEMFKSMKMRIPSKYNVPDRKFILYVGSEQKRKNVDKILEALTIVKKKHPEILFVKIGRPQEEGAREKLKNIIKKLKLEDNVIFINYVPEKDLPTFYNNASVFVFPSSYEGFGLPVLEAMACGCPVITTKCTSLPEIGGEAVIYVKPRAVDEISKNITDILKDNVKYHEMSQKILKQAQKFDWNYSGTIVNKVYKNI